jgi:serine/threonine protein kinase
MAIQSGTHLGPYEILSAIGAGGMGEVYRARDPKLGRDVAIKVLPEAFALNPDRMARFRRAAGPRYRGAEGPRESLRRHMEAESCQVEICRRTSTQERDAHCGGPRQWLEI